MKRNTVRALYNKSVVLVSNIIGYNTLHTFGTDYMSLEGQESLTLSIHNHTLKENTHVMYETIGSWNSDEDNYKIFNKFKTYIENIMASKNEEVKDVA